MPVFQGEINVSLEFIKAKRKTRKISKQNIINILFTNIKVYNEENERIKLITLKN